MSHIITLFQIFKSMCWEKYVRILMIPRGCAFLAFPGLPLHFLKTIEGIDMELIPLIKHREINLLLLSYLSCDVT